MLTCTFCILGYFLLVEVLSKCDGCNLHVQYDFQNQYLKSETVVRLNVCPKISPEEI